MHFSAKSKKEVYDEKANSLILSLNNQFMRLRLLCGELNVIQLVQAKSLTLASDSKKVELDKTLYDNLITRRSDWNLARPLSGVRKEFKCRKCNSKNASYW